MLLFYKIINLLYFSFGMLHDGDGNSCHETTGNIMSATLTAQSGIFHWSTCSRESMRNFLK